MTPTDQSLKQALAKMLPEKFGFNKQLIHKTLSSRTFPVLDTELLQICWEIEEGLKPSDARQYQLQVGRIIVQNDKDAYWKDVSGSIQTYSFHATWQQRTIALAQVKGIEII